MSRPGLARLLGRSPTSRAPDSDVPCAPRSSMLPLFSLGENEPFHSFSAHGGGGGGLWVERPRKHWAAAESGSTDVPGPRASSCPSTPETSACSVPRLPSPLPPPGLKAPAWLGGEAPRLGPEYLVPAPPPRWHLANPPALNSVPLDPLRGKGTSKHLGDHPS